MKITKKEKITVTALKGIVCDICGKRHNTDEGWEDMEIQEFVCVHRTGGYSSIFGDGEKIDVDICQYCFYKICQEYNIKIESKK